jgi:enolase-phosphatase E1
MPWAEVMAFNLSHAGIGNILLDIEGTTTPIAFVHDVLFSYARENLESHLREHSDSADLRDDIAKLRGEHAVDLRQGLHPPVLVEDTREAQIDSLAGYASWLIDRDRKSTGLKSLQGKIWRQGYLEGTLKAQIFPDVPTALERWHRAGLTVSIFSSGSVLAQELLFAHTEAGDLTPYIDGFFDTTIGPKVEAESYHNIAKALRLLPIEVLFISDVSNELAAAEDAGMQTLLCFRTGNQPQENAERYQSIGSFDEIV